MRIPAWVLIAALASSHVIVGWRAWTWATELAEVRHAAARDALENDLAAVAEKARAAALAMQVAQAAQDRNAEDIEAEARADPAAAGRVPSADSLHRLKARWGAN